MTETLKRNYTKTEKMLAAREASKKEFINPENQELWDLYYNNKINTDLQSGKDIKSIRMSVNTYKPPIRQFEEKLNGKSFADITAEDFDLIEKGENYIKGFLINCIENDWLYEIDKEVILQLIPETYRKIAQILVK